MGLSWILTFELVAFLVSPCLLLLVFVFFVFVYLCNCVIVYVFLFWAGGRVLLVSPMFTRSSPRGWRGRYPHTGSLRTPRPGPPLLLLPAAACESGSKQLSNNPLLPLFVARAGQYYLLPHQPVEQQSKTPLQLSNIRSSLWSQEQATPIAATICCYFLDIAVARYSSSGCGTF